MKRRGAIRDIDMAKRAHRAEGDLKKAKRRLQSKLNQRRYRAEQRYSTARLHQAVLDLRAEVARMEGRAEIMRLAVHRPLRTCEPECKTSNEYIRLFANGFNLDATTAQHNGQISYLTSAMSQDLVMMGAKSRSKLVGQWVLYMTTFEAVSMALHTAQVVYFTPSAIVHLDTTLHLRLSRKSIKLLFPHLATNEPLAQRLAGQELHLRAQQRFIFDSNGVVQEIGTYANTTAALVHLLGSLDDAVAVLGDCQLTEGAELIHR